MAARSEPIANGDHDSLIDRVLWVLGQPDLPIDSRVGPSFQFYPTDWLADRLVVRMSRVAAAIHMQCMCLAWSEHPPCSLPAGKEDLEDLFEGVSDADRRAVMRAWVVRGGRMWQPGLCKSFLSQIWNRLKKTEGGFAKAKNEKGLSSLREVAAVLLSTCTAGIKQDESGKTSCTPIAESCIPSSSSSSSSSTTSEEKSSCPTATPSDAIARPVNGHGKTYPADFLAFYAPYPRHEAKDDALKAWKATASSRPPIEEIVAAIEEQKKSDNWRKEGGKFIPLPATWLRAGRWADSPGIEGVSLFPRESQRGGLGAFGVTAGVLLADRRNLGRSPELDAEIEEDRRRLMANREEEDARRAALS